MSDFPPPNPNGRDQVSNWLSRSNSFSRSLRVVESPDIYPKFSPQGVGLFIKKKGGGTENPVLPYEVHSVLSDYLICRRVLTLNGAQSTLDEKVAKPFTLRKSYGTGDHEYPINNPSETSRKTFFYHEGVSKVAIDEAVDPPYTIGDRIMVSRVGEEGTGLANVFLIDLNIDGRHWAWQKKLTKICVDDTEKITYILRTGEFEI